MSRTTFSMNSIVSKTFNRIDNHVLKLFRIVSGLFDVHNANSKFSDVRLIIGSKTFYCHRFVLVLDSKFFSNLSFWSRTGTLYIPNLNPDQFFDVLQFMYTGQILVSTNNIESLLVAADILCMDDLKKVCSRFLYDSFNMDNGPLYRQLNKYGLNGLGVTSLQNTSEETMKAILSDERLEVKRELEVCEMLMKWLEVQTVAENEVHPDQLLPLIRWSSISLNYVKSKLNQNTALTSDLASIRFLTKVITYLESGVQFENLQTFHRPSTGLDNSLLVVGLDSGNQIHNTIFSISFQYRNKVKALASIPTMMNIGSASCLLNNHVYITGIGDKLCKEAWTWNLSSHWSRCADMLTGRQYHCVTVVEGTLYVLGGWVKTTKSALNSVECYNTQLNKWFSAGQLINPVWCSTCVTYNDSIYVFGGLDKHENPVTCVQVYNPALDSCQLMDKPMPEAHSHMAAVLWETSVILLGYYTCFMYNFLTDTWQERKQFKTRVGYIATALDNSTIYIAGGGRHGMKTNDEFVCTDEIRSVSVLDIVEDRTAVWKQHAKLTKPAMIISYLSTSLAL